MGLSPTSSFLVIVSVVALIITTRQAAFAANPGQDIAVGKSPRAIVVRPVGPEEIYVANEGDSTVSVIDAKTNRTVPIRVAGPPVALVASPDGSRIYVGYGGFGGVGAIDANAKALAQGQVSSPGSVSGLAITPDGSKLYVATISHGQIEEIDIGAVDRLPVKASMVNVPGCPFGLAPAGRRLYVSVQCAPQPGSYGHDPIFVLDVTNDTLISAETISHLNRNSGGVRLPLANVGGTMVASPAGDEVWANGIDACSNPSYDFRGCPPLEEGESPIGRGIFNIIFTTTGVIRRLPFPATTPGHPSVQFGASSAAFSPDGHQVAVTTESSVLFFDPVTLFQSGSYAVPHTGAVVFSRDGSRLYATIPTKNLVSVLQLRTVPPTLFTTIQESISAAYEYFGPIKAIPFSLAMLMILWAALSFRFARTFANNSVLRFPLDLEVYLRKRRSRLVQLYLRQLEFAIRAHGTRIVPLPVTVYGSARGNSIGTRNESRLLSTTDKWLEEVPTKLRSNPDYRIAIRGEGGTGKTVLMQALVLRLIEQGFVPMMLRAAAYDNQTTLDAWVDRQLNVSSVPLSARVWQSLPDLVYVIDQASEVKPESQLAFQRLIASQFDVGTPRVNFVIAGRFIVDPTPINQNSAAATSADQHLPWDELLVPGDLEDKHIRQIAAGFLDPKSEEIDILPTTLRSTIMPKPTAFVVSMYARVQVHSLSPIKDQQDLYRGILAFYVGDDSERKIARPQVTQAILKGLVKKNWAGGDRQRGLPNREALVNQVDEVVTEDHLMSKFGQVEFPIPAEIANRLLSSGLLYQVSATRWFFFHDSFEDWLAF